MLFATVRNVSSFGVPEAISSTIFFALSGFKLYFLANDSMSPPSSITVCNPSFAAFFNAPLSVMPTIDLRANADATLLAPY